jgi:uncharacterized protein YqjF (DUF2071 family)
VTGATGATGATGGRADDGGDGHDEGRQDHEHTAFVARIGALAAAPGPHPPPRLPWICAQRWDDVLVMSWRVPERALRPLVPDALELDRFDGDTWVSLLPLRMARVHLRDVPPLPHLSDFPELNLRTYVVAHGRPGVWFLGIHAPNHVNVWIGRHVFHVNYELAHMSRRHDRNGTRFTSERDGGHARLDVTYRPEGEAAQAPPGSLEAFLSERYSMFVVDHEGHVRRGDIRHSPWQLQGAHVRAGANTVTQAAGLPDLGPPHEVRYSAGTDSVVWPMVRS